jgi:hypothetical protein
MEKPRFNKRDSYTRSDELPKKTQRILRDIRVEKCEVTIENKPTIIDEKSRSVLKYKTPHFK